MKFINCSDSFSLCIPHVDTRPSPMLSISIFGSVLPPMKSRADAKAEAVTFLGLLRHNEDRLVERTKSLIKHDRQFISEMFTTMVDEWTPLHACTLRGARKLIKIALKCGANPDLEMGNPEDIPGHCSPLHLAAYRGDVSIIQLLAHYGASLDKKDSANRTALYYAVERRNTLAAKKLLKYGADASDLSIEQRVFYRDDIDSKSNSLSCIGLPSRSHSNKHKFNSSSKYKTDSSS